MIATIDNPPERHLLVNLIIYLISYNVSSKKNSMEGCGLKRIVMILTIDGLGNVYQRHCSQMDTVNEENCDCD